MPRFSALGHRPIISIFAGLTSLFPGDMFMNGI